MMSDLIVSRFGSRIGQFFQNRSYWAVRLRDNSWLTEIDHYRGYRPEQPYYDWTLDLVDTGDVTRIAELWLFCPRSKYNPLGSTASYHFHPWEFNQALQIKRGTYSNTGMGIASQIIGKITDPATGECNCCIWDGRYRLMLVNFITNIHHFESWDEALKVRLHTQRLQKQVAPLGLLDKRTLGLR